MLTLPPNGQTTNDMKINSEKSKEMIISYAHGNIGNEVPNILIDGKVVERVDHVKLLGITLSNDLTWTRHVDNIVKKAGKIIYMLYQLKRAGVNQAVPIAIKAKYGHINMSIFKTYCLTPPLSQLTPCH